MTGVTEHVRSSNYSGLRCTGEKRRNKTTRIVQKLCENEKFSSYNYGWSLSQSHRNFFWQMISARKKLEKECFTDFKSCHYVHTLLSGNWSEIYLTGEWLQTAWYTSEYFHFKAPCQMNIARQKWWKWKWTLPYINDLHRSLDFPFCSLHEKLLYFLINRMCLFSNKLAEIMRVRESLAVETFLKTLPIVVAAKLCYSMDKKAQH